MKRIGYQVVVFAATVALSAAACGPKTGGSGTRGGGNAHRAAAGSGTKTVAKSSAGATSNPEALKVFRQGVHTLEQGRKKGKATHQQAIQQFKKATDLDPNFAEAYYNLGVVYEDLGKYSTARRAYARATKAKPGFTEAYVALGRVYIHEGDTEKAKNLYTKLLKQDPTNEGFRNQVVVILRMERNYNGAIQQVRQILFKSPDNVEAYKNLSLVYLDMGKYDLAKLVCANALKINSKDPGIYNNLGLIYLRQNDVVSANAQFKKATELDPNFMPALMNRSALALDHKDYAGAEAALNQVLVQKPFDLSALNALAVAKRGQGQNDEAKKIYQRLIEADPTNPEPVYNLGVLYQLGYKKPAQALKYYDAYVNKAQPSKQHPVWVMQKAARVTIAKAEKEAAEAAKAEAEMKAAEAEMKRQMEEQKRKEEAAKQEAAKKNGDKKEGNNVAENKDEKKKSTNGAPKAEAPTNKPNDTAGNKK